MTDETRDRTPDQPGDDDLEHALRVALDHRAGGPFAAAATAPLDDDRLTVIESAVARGHGDRRITTFLSLAAAVVVVLVVSLAVARRGGDSTIVQSTGDGTSSTAAPTTTVTTVATPPSSTPAGAGTTPVADVRGVDLANLTYPISVCPKEMNIPADTVTLVGGHAAIMQTTADGFRYGHLFDLKPDVVYGDVTGDGVDDALALITCSLTQSDDVRTDLVVVSMVDGAPKVIGSLVVSGVAKSESRTYAGTDQTYVFTPFELILEVHAVDGQLAVRWNQVASAMGYQYQDQRQVTVTYHWDGTTFQPVGESDVVIVPGVPPATVPPSTTAATAGPGQPPR